MLWHSKNPVHKKNNHEGGAEGSWTEKTCLGLDPHFCPHLPAVQTYAYRSLCGCSFLHVSLTARLNL